MSSFSNLKPLKFCHVKGGRNHFDFHAWLSNISIESLKYDGCEVKIIKVGSAVL